MKKFFVLYYGAIIAITGVGMWYVCHIQKEQSDYVRLRYNQYLHDINQNSNEAR